MIVNHEYYTRLDAVFFLDPLPLGNIQSYGVLYGFAAALVAHFVYDFVEVFEEFRWKRYAYSGDFRHGNRLLIGGVLYLKGFVKFLVLDFCFSGFLVHVKNRYLKNLLILLSDKFLGSGFVYYNEVISFVS